MFGLIPDRKLTEAEFERIQSMIMNLYWQFVDSVAEGRLLSRDEVHAMAQGRVWSGTEAMKRGLVDRIGGLRDAIQLAASKVGLRRSEQYEVVEYPKRPWFDFGIFSPTKVASREIDAMIDYLDFRLKRNGQVMPLLPLEMTDFEED